jgi:LysM repeat protein
MIRFGPLLGMLTLVLLVLTGCITDDDSPEETPGETPDEVLRIVTLTPVPSATMRTEMVEYVVEEGDTLSGIADDHGVSPGAIVETNGLPNPDAIFAGQTLMIPAPSEGTPDS